MLLCKRLLMTVLHILNCNILIIFKLFTINLKLYDSSHSFDFPTIKCGRKANTDHTRICY